MTTDPDTLKRRDDDDRRIAAALREVGLEIDSVFDYVNARPLEKEAVQPLLQVLPKVQDLWMKQGIVRALTDKKARGIATKPFVDEIKRFKGKESYGWAIGNALKIIADKSVLEDLLEIAQDEEFGYARQTIAEALARFKKDPRVPKVLVDLLKDEQVAGHAIVALRKVGDKSTLPGIEPFLEHPKAWIRREAKKAVAKLSGS